MPISNLLAASLKMEVKDLFFFQEKGAEGGGEEVQQTAVGDGTQVGQVGRGI